MLKIQKEGIVLGPTANAFESRSVLNPAIYQEGEDVHVIYRAIDQDYMSTLGYAKLEGPKEVVERWDHPYMTPKKRIESRGIEDPHIAKIGDIFYLTYVVHDGKNAITAFSYGDDMFHLKRGGLISPKIPYKDAGKIFSYTKLKDDYYFFEAFYQKYSDKNVLIWHKDCILFPEKIDHQFFMLQRILPDIQYLEFEDFSQLKDKYFWIYNIMNLADHVLIEGAHGFEARHIGGGATPVKTKDGWLIIYHAVQEFNKKRIYHAGAALLSLENPRQLIARLPYPLFSPQEPFELTGTVNNVVFPTGTAIFGEDLYIYYGAADSCIAVAKVNLEELLAELLKNKVVDH